jgi:hypothetical protein
MCAKMILPDGEPPNTWDLENPVKGLNELDPRTFEGKLFRREEVHHRGVPSMLARPYAFGVRLEQAAARGTTTGAHFQLALLMQALFLGLLELRVHSLATNCRLCQAYQGFEPGAEEVVVLCWQGKAVAASYSDTLVFPGARFLEASQWRDRMEGESPEPAYVQGQSQEGGKVSYEPDITLQALQQEVEAELERQGPDVVKALFGLWIGEMVTAFRNRHDQPLPVWLSSLLQFAKQAWQTPLVPPEDALGQFTEVVKTLSASGVEVPLRRLTIRLFCQRLITFAGNRTAELPVPSENLHLLELGACTVNLAGPAPQYSLQLRGWQGLAQWSPPEDVLVRRGRGGGYEASILLWPNFRDPGWRLNYAYFGGSGDVYLRGVGIRLLDQDFQRLAELKVNEGCRTPDSVAFVEVLDKDGASLGIFPDPRPQAPTPHGESLVLSLDFGTSNTLLAQQDPNHAGQYIAYALEDASYDLLGEDFWWKSSDMVSFRNGARFLPTACLDKGQKTVSLPSELIFKDRQTRNQGDAVLQEPARNYLIPHIMMDRDAAAEQMVTEFKRPDFHVEGFDREELIRAYLTMVLHLVCAQVRGREQATNLNLVFTYPLAFGASGYHTFRNLLAGGQGQRGLLQEVGEQTGLKLGLAWVDHQATRPEMVAESYAVKAFAMVGSNRNAAELVVDVGGGTTDFALWTAQEELVDSVEYGASIYVSFLADNLGYGRNAIPPAEGNIEAFIMLQRDIRQHGIRKVLAGYNEDARRRARNGLLHFFLGIMAYSNQLIRSQGVERVMLYPRGNGWRLLDALGQNENNILGHCQKNLAFPCQVDIPSAGDFKAAVAKGARYLADAGTYLHPSPLEVHTILGGGLSIDGSDKPWNTPVPLEVEPTLQVDSASFFEDWEKATGVKMSDDLISSEETKLNAAITHSAEPLPNTIGRKELPKSAMAVYLERVYAPRLVAGKL